MRAVFIFAPASEHFIGLRSDLPDQKRIKDDAGILRFTLYNAIAASVIGLVGCITNGSTTWGGIFVLSFIGTAYAVHLLNNLFNQILQLRQSCDKQS